MPTPWHQDQPYYCVDGSDTVTLWISLDLVPRDRTLEFVGGSHKWGKYFRPERFDKTPLNENEGSRPCRTSTATGTASMLLAGAGAGRCGGLQLHDAPWGARQ